MADFMFPISHPASLSVVIPTYNRCAILQKALSAYLKQNEPRCLAEILVVDDGSTDPTGATVDRLSKTSPVPIRYFWQQNKGPAAARNVGIREAASEIILFTDDDIIPGRDLVAEHIKCHARHPHDATAVVGYVTWSHEINPTPFMQWYGLEALFSFADIAGQAEVDYRYFYTCNLSLKREFLLRNGMFDEDFKIASWEDIELGFRLQSAGMHLLYNSQAVAYHKQFISFSDACKRNRKSLAALEIFKQKDAGRHCTHLTTTEGKQRIKRLLAPICYPFVTLMDCRVPLPRSVYRTVFRICR
jgi:glycosyltransferase involved in cell wall biosynthesis